MDRGRVMAIGRWGLIGGVLVVTLGTLGGRPTVAWVGVALSGLALAVNSLGKLAQYGRLDIPQIHRVLVVTTWLCLALAVFGLVVDYTYANFATAYDGYFWPLVVAAFGLTLIYEGMRIKFVPGSESPLGVESSEISAE